jgi:predicted transcriptional regulator
MARRSEGDLSRRERQIMDVIYQQGEASVSEVLEALPDPPSYSSVRALLGILVEKGHLKHRKTGIKYVYSPRRSRQTAGKSAVRRLVHTFFDGSAVRAVAALLDDADTKLSDEEFERLAELIDEHRNKEQRS